MIQHGMGAFLSEKGPVIVEDFDPAAVWKSILDELFTKIELI